jgi:hypothetical protein
MQKRDLPMNLAVVPNVVLHARPNQGAAIAVAMANQTVRCMRLLVQTAANPQRYHLSPAVISLSIAEIVIRRSQEETAGRN